jgi:hypothetical protein
MSSCIIFAATILSHEREFVLRRFMETFQTKFNSADLYVGINPNSIPNAESIIKEYNLNTQTVRVTQELYCESDASAYQAALRLLFDSKKQYDTYWFVHTKSGVNNHSDYLRDWYINNFLSRKTDIESFMIDNKVGSYGMLGLEYDPFKEYTETDVEIKLWEDDITDELPYTHSNFFYIHTIYAISKEPINIFFNLITDKWFETKLNRYYFEGVFPFLVSRTGYFPYLENQFSMTGKDLSHNQSLWVLTNRLENKYNNLLNKFKTSYHFNQLNPPYVNRNTQS